MSKINMKITLEVKGSEDFIATQEYIDTDMTTVRRVQNALLKSGIELNKEDLDNA